MATRHSYALDEILFSDVKHVLNFFRKKKHDLPFPRSAFNDKEKAFFFVQHDKPLYIYFVH